MSSIDDQINKKRNEQMENIKRDLITFNSIQELIDKVSVGGRRGIFKVSKQKVNVVEELVSAYPLIVARSVCFDD